MTNAKQIKQVFHPLLARHTDLFAVRSRFLFIKPVHHIALQVVIERSSHADFASPQWSIFETFMPSWRLDNMIGLFGGYFFRNEIDTQESSRSWRWSHPTMLDELIARIEHDILPFLRCIGTVEDYAAFYRRMFDRFRIEHPENRMIVDIALGDLDAARETCLELLPKYRENQHETWWLYQNLRTKVVTVAEPLMAGDRQALAEILHGWEAANIRGTKLEPHWERTPFPLEMA